MQDGQVPAEEIPEQGGGQDDAAEWLTLAEAARRAGCSIDTLRRRLKRGELEARQVATRHGQAWQVRLGELQTVGNEPTRAAQSGDAAELVRLVRDQQQTIMELSGRVGYFQAQLEQARETIRALEAPKAAEVAPDAMPGSGTAPEPITRPWWRRWLGHG